MENALNARRWGGSFIPRVALATWAMLRRSLSDTFEQKVSWSTVPLRQLEKETISEISIPCLRVGPQECENLKFSSKAARNSATRGGIVAIPIKQCSANSAFVYFTPYDARGRPIEKPTPCNGGVFFPTYRSKEVDQTRPCLHISCENSIVTVGNQPPHQKTLLMIKYASLVFSIKQDCFDVEIRYQRKVPQTKRGCLYYAPIMLNVQEPRFGLCYNTNYSNDENVITAIQLTVVPNQRMRIGRALVVDTKPRTIKMHKKLHTVADTSEFKSFVHIKATIEDNKYIPLGKEKFRDFLEPKLSKPREYQTTEYLEETLRRLNDLRGQPGAGYRAFVPARLFPWVSSYKPESRTIHETNFRCLRYLYDQHFMGDAPHKQKLINTVELYERLDLCRNPQEDPAIDRAVCCSHTKCEQQTTQRRHLDVFSGFRVADPLDPSAPRRSLDTTGLVLAYHPLVWLCDEHAYEKITAMKQYTRLRKKTVAREPQQRRYIFDQEMIPRLLAGYSNSITTPELLLVQIVNLAYRLLDAKKPATDVFFRTMSNLLFHTQ